MSSTTKIYDLDHIPTSLVKECADVLKTPIINIINYSLKEGSFPKCFEAAYRYHPSQITKYGQKRPKIKDLCQFSVLYHNKKIVAK